MPTENPFKGPSSYEDGDKFYGRENEIKELTGLIKNETLTLIFSRSGTGKSSLIKAGIFPALKAEYEFFPIYIHLNDGAVKETSAKNLCDFVIKRSIEDIKDYFSTKGNFSIVSPENKKPHSLFEFTHNLQIIGTDKSSPGDEPPIEYLIKPVFFFDQFEEIFTQPFDKNELQSFLKEIKCLVENEVPDYLKEEIIASKDSQYIRLRNALKSKQKSFRVVFSFREEYLPQFESLRNEIPSIRFTNSRYRLEPFPVATAKTIIVKTAPAISDETALDVSESIAMQIEGFDEIKVDPFLLSLICQIIYPDLLQQNHTSSEEAKLRIKSLVENAIESYVEKVYKTIDEETKKFIEQKLITSDGKKNSVNYNEVENNSRLKSNLEKLAENPSYRLLSIGQFLDSRHVSILHDRLLPPLIKRKEERKSREDYEAFIITQTKWNAKNKRRQIYFFALFTAGLLVFGSFYYVIYQNKKSAGKLREQAEAAYSEAGKQKMLASSFSEQAEIANEKAKNEHSLAEIEKDSAFHAIILAKENQSKYLNQKNLTDSITKVTASLQKVKESLQNSVDSNNVQKDLTQHNINYYLGNQASLLPFIFDRLLHVKKDKNEEKYNEMLQSIDTALLLKTEYATSVSARDMLTETKKFWKKHRDNEVADSIITGFLNNTIYYGQKIELDEDNSMRDRVKPSLSVAEAAGSEMKGHFAFNYNNNIYHAIFNTNSDSVNIEDKPFFSYNPLGIIPNNSSDKFDTANSDPANSIVYHDEEIIGLSRNYLFSYVPQEKYFKAKYKINIGNNVKEILSPDATHAITYSQEGNVNIILWNVADTADKHILRTKATGVLTKATGVKSILFSKDSKKILILNDLGNLSMYDAALQYKEFKLSPKFTFQSANFTNNGNKIVGISSSIRFIKNMYVSAAYFCGINALDAQDSVLEMPKIMGYVPYTNGIYSVTFSPDESKMLLGTTKGITICSPANKDSGLVSYSGRSIVMLPYKNFYSTDTTRTAAFLNSGAVVTIGDSANVYLLKLYPDFKTPDEAFNTIKLPPLSITDSLKAYPDDTALYKRVLSSNNERIMRDAAQFYYESDYPKSYPPDTLALNMSIELYTRLINISVNNKDRYAQDLIPVYKTLARLYPQNKIKAIYYDSIINLYEKYKVVGADNDISGDYGDLSFYLFFTKDFKNALAYAIKGIQKYSANDFIYTNLALGYLFTNQFAKAEEVYNNFKDKIIQTPSLYPLSFKDGFKQDFESLEDHGIINKNDPIIYAEMEKIRDIILK